MTNTPKCHEVVLASILKLILLIIETFHHLLTAHIKINILE